MKSNNVLRGGELRGREMQKETGGCWVAASNDRDGVRHVKQGVGRQLGNGKTQLAQIRWSDGGVRLLTA